MLVLSSLGELSLPLGGLARWWGVPGAFILSWWLPLLGACEQQGWSHLIGIYLGQGQQQC